MLDSKSLNQRYFGDFQNDQFQGRGWLRYTDGTIYVGEFEKGLRHGNENKIIYSKNRGEEINLSFVEGKLI